MTNSTRLSNESAIDVLRKNCPDRLTLVKRRSFDTLREREKSSVAVP